MAKRQNEICYVDVEISIGTRRCRMCKNAIKKGTPHLHIHHNTEGHTQNHNICPICINAVKSEIVANRI